MDNAVQLEDELKQKALDRIETMEAPGYVFPEPFSRADRVAAGIVIVATALWLFAGIWM